MAMRCVTMVAMQLAVCVGTTESETIAALGKVPRVTRNNCHNLGRGAAPEAPALGGLTGMAAISYLRSIPRLSQSNCDKAFPARPRGPPNSNRADYNCGHMCASYCNPFSCFLQQCAGCTSCQSPMPRPGDVSGLPTCGATWPSTPPTTYSSVLSAENSITAITAMIPGDVSLFATNCGASGVAVQPMAATSVVTGDAFGAVSMGTRVTAGGTPPGGLHTLNQGANYFWTVDRQTQNPNPTFATYSPCNYNGVLAYCSGHQLGYDYDYDGDQDMRTYCVSFEESQYCDGAANARMYAWQVRFHSEVGREAGWFSMAVNPFTSPPTPATFACKTDALMPAGLGLSYVPAAGSSSSVTSASLEGCSLCHCGATASGQSAAGCIPA